MFRRRENMDDQNTDERLIVGGRYLAEFGDEDGEEDSVLEFVVVEFSPSQKYVKVKFADDDSSWYDVETFLVLEKLK